jgi:mono/diheme cytochrome c family protein
MNKICITVTISLLLIISAGIYKFILPGGAAESTDDRIVILLNDSERNLVLTEMREFLNSIQQINQGLSENDMTLVIKAARRSGKAAQASMPGTLVVKLPPGFKKLGGDTHTRFDQLAMDAQDLEDSSHTLQQLSLLMQNCVSCHAVYRIDI